MTRSEAELKMIDIQIESLTKQVEEQTTAMMRRAEEMKDAAGRGYDLTCHAANVSSVATELAVLSARLDTLTQTRRMIRDIVSIDVA